MCSNDCFCVKRFTSIPTKHRYSMGCLPLFNNIFYLIIVSFRSTKRIFMSTSGGSFKKEYQKSFNNLINFAFFGDLCRY